jgi:hypothetical protein
VDPHPRRWGSTSVMMLSCWVLVNLLLRSRGVVITTISSIVRILLSLCVVQACGLLGP